jgi:hypothetical protein
MGRTRFTAAKKPAYFAKTNTLLTSTTSEHDGFEAFDALLDAKPQERFQTTWVEIQLLKNSEKIWRLPDLSSCTINFPPTLGGIAIGICSSSHPHPQPLGC